MTTSRLLILQTLLWFTLVLLAPSLCLAGKESDEAVNRIHLVGDKSGWVETGIKARPQDLITLRAGSEVCFAGEDGCTRPGGWSRETYATDWPGSAAECDDPFPEWNHAALIAKIGEETVLVGRSTTVEGKEGRIELGINDCSFDGPFANRGQFSVVVVLENPTALAARNGREWIEAALDAMGGKNLRRINSLETLAECTGPGGPFTTQVISLRPERTLFRQFFEDVEDVEDAEDAEDGSIEWLAQAGKAWSINREAGTRKALGKKLHAMILGHEFHLMLFELDERFQKHTLAEESEAVEGSGGESGEANSETEPGCVRIEMEDLYGAPASICLDRETSMPLRMTMQPSGQKKEPTITIEFDGWMELDEIQYVESFTLTHGEAVFTYNYSEIVPNGVDRAVFREISPRRLKAIRKENKRPESDEAPGASEESKPEEAPTTGS